MSEEYDSKNSRGFSELLMGWKNRLHTAQAGHYMATEKFLKYSQYIGIPLAVITTIVGTSLFMEDGIFHSYITPVLSCIAALLASIQAFIKPAEKAELHRQKATKYGALKRKVEKFLSSNHSDQDKRIFLDNLGIEWDHIASDTPLTPLKMREKASLYAKKEQLNDKKLNVYREAQNNSPGQ